MNRWLKFRLAVAQLVLRGTEYGVGHSTEIANVTALSDRLTTYVQKSGGLNTPRRIRAYRHVLSYASRIKNAANGIQVVS